MKDLIDNFSFEVEFRNISQRNKATEILTVIAEDQGVYLHIEENTTCGLNLGVSDPDHYSALMDEFDRQSIRMKEQSEANYHARRMEQAERLGVVFTRPPNPQLGEPT
ncbi:hypothetical protein [Labrenzia sp. PHM005]|uniref:hypothetical protein n=1 Tax=Labrenzia sp. PHM005 TaxID=2590016 RepID=UPI0011401B2B|nr:hypothetical protein [Labrenzia sp. PHM005]QDG74384.1 hypothetical protein FJ695_00015 [Labrenzia sp. PHM005]